MDRVCQIVLEDTKYAAVHGAGALSECSVKRPRGMDGNQYVMQCMTEQITSAFLQEHEHGRNKQPVWRQSSSKPTECYCSAARRTQADERRDRRDGSFLFQEVSS